MQRWNRFIKSFRERDVTIIPPPHDNDRFPAVKPEALEQSFTRLFSHPEQFPLLGL